MTALYLTWLREDVAALQQKTEEKKEDVSVGGCLNALITFVALQIAAVTTAIFWFVYYHTDGFSKLREVKQTIDP